MSAKILIVDDSDTIRQQVGITLAQAGYEVLEAQDGVEGLSTIGAARDIALVICDINMPNMGGIEMLTAVKADTKNANLPVLMLTTEAKAELIQQAKRIGAKGWVVKPFKPDQLAAAVRKIVGH
jgi:two-component system, chemotaxis family, chemotaxis protein CheY